MKDEYARNYHYNYWQSLSWLTLPGPRPPVYLPKNLKFYIKKNVTIQVQSPNKYGKLPYAIDWVLVKKLLKDQHPFVSCETNHNFIFGQNRLLFDPRNGTLGWTDWEACERESAIRNPFHQPLPIVNEYNARNANAWKASGTWAAFSTSTSAPSSSNARVITTPAASSSLRAFATFFALLSARAFTSFAACARAAALSTFASLFARASPVTPFSMSCKENH